LLSATNSDLKKEIQKYKEQAVTLSGESDLRSKYLHNTKEDLIDQMKIVEMQLAELLALRTETRILKL
jgi:hypothetical protein